MALIIISFTCLSFSSTFVITTCSMWDVDQPDDYGPTGEDCALIRANGMWNDYPCGGYNWPYVCERPNGKKTVEE